MKIKFVFWLVFTVLFNILAFSFEYRGLWLIAACMGFVPIMSLIMILCGRFRIRFKQYAENTVFEKSKGTRLILECTNKTIFIYPKLKIKYRTGVRQEKILYPGANSFSCDFSARYKGVYDIGAEKIIVSDLFGMFCFSFKFKEDELVYSIPEPKDIKMLSDPGKSGNTAKEVKTADHSEDKNIISDLREYRYGDTLNKINWKATAKYSDVIVNNYENRFYPKTLIYVGGLYKNDDEISRAADDFACEVAISIVKRLLSANKNFTLFYEGKEDMADSETNKEIQDYGIYLANASGKNSYFEDIGLVENTVLGNGGYSGVILITENIYDEIYKFFDKLQNTNTEMDVYRVIRESDTKLRLKKIDLRERTEK